jgi:hypothetical protein
VNQSSGGREARIAEVHLWRTPTKGNDAKCEENESRDDPHEHMLAPTVEDVLPTECHHTSGLQHGTWRRSSEHRLG